MMTPRKMFCLALTMAIGVAACSDSEPAAAPRPVADSPTPDEASEPSATTASSLRVVTPADAAATIAEAPEGLVILDVRTPEEFDEAHIEGAIMLDFYRDDFAEELAKLDPDVPYVLYCRSGNRSGQTLEMMEGFGFTDVEDVGGGIIDWQSAGLPVVSG